jgi:hypothetical protein
MMDSAESGCLFDGLDSAKDAMLKAVRAMCDARHIEDAERAASEFGKLIDVLGHMIGAGLAARDGDTQTANLEAAAVLDDFRHFSDDSRPVPQAPASLLAGDPRRLPDKERERRKHFLKSLRTSLRSEAETLAQRYGLKTEQQRTDRNGWGKTENKDDQSPSWSGLLNWFYFSFHLSASVEDALSGKRREAKKELKEAQDIAVDSLGGQPLEVVQCARLLSDRLIRPHLLKLVGAGALVLALAGAVIGALSASAQSPDGQTVVTTAPTSTSPPSTTSPPVSTTTTSPPCQPQITLDPSSLDFGKQPAGSSTSKTVEITATPPSGACDRDPKSILIIDESITGQPSNQTVFTVSSDCAEKSIAPSDSCSEMVAFKPDAAASGPFTATMQVSANGALNSPQSVSLTAAAIPIQLQ